MLIQQTSPSVAGIIQDIPKQLLAELAVGQRLEVIAIKSALAGELLQLKALESLLNVRLPENVTQGQRVLLEVVLQNGKPTLQFIPSEVKSQPNEQVNKLTAELLAALKVGQKIPAEVIKTLGAQQVLLEAQVKLPSQSQAVKQQIIVDVTQLKSPPLIGDKPNLVIESVKPLQVVLQAQPAIQEAKQPVQQPLVQETKQIVQQQIQRVLSQVIETPVLNKVISQTTQSQLPLEVKQQVQALLNNSLDKSQVRESNALKQAVQNSGVFTEKMMLSQTGDITRDFKANVIKLMVVLSNAIEQGNLTVNKEAKALINQLPAQVQSALASAGKTPQQLLSVLLSTVNKPVIEPALLAQLSPVITDSKQASMLVQMLTEGKGNTKQIEANIAQLQSMLRGLEGVHNKIQLNQLAMVRDPDLQATNVQASWLFDIPIKDKQNLDLVQLKIDQEKQSKSSKDGEQDTWQVELRLETQNLGPMQVTLSLHEQEVAIELTAQRPESAALLEQDLAILRHNIERLDLTVSKLACHCGDIPERSLAELAVQSTSILDVSV